MGRCVSSRRSIINSNNKLTHYLITGPSYTDFEVYDLSVMQPYPLEKLNASFVGPKNAVVLYLPRTSDLRQLVKHSKDDAQLKVIHYCMHGASKALCVYYGDFALD